MIPSSTRVVALSRDGFAIADGVIAGPECDRLIERCTDLDSDGAGTRDVLARTWARELAMRLVEHPAVEGLVPEDHVPIQCIYFNKRPETNWLVPFHQDLTILFRERVAHPELTGWSRKEGIWFAQPPVSVLESLLAIRLHLDDCPARAGAVRVLPGTHRCGRINEAAIEAYRARAPEVVCEVQRGGLLILRPLLLHASSKSASTAPRRVLHFVFGPRELPYC